MDPKIKEAFDRVKEDLSFLSNEINNLKTESELMKESLDNKIVYSINHFSSLINHKIESLKEQMGGVLKALEDIKNPTHFKEKPTFSTINPTIQQIQQPLKTQNLAFSTGNKGVPTDKPTDKPTHQQIPILGENSPVLKENDMILKEDKPIIKKNDFDQAIKILESLDGIKKEIRRKFKQLTPMEMEVFSILYSLEEAGEEADYRLIALKLNLSESSIRDYIGRISAKGIPISKEKINNKKVILKISPDLKKIASLNTIMQLREL